MTGPAPATPTVPAWTPAELAVLMAADDPRTTAQWAADTVVVPEGPLAGAKYDPGFAPYFAGLWEVLRKPWVRQLVVIASPQCGKTLFSMVFMARRSQERPGPRMIALPNETTAAGWFDKKLIPLLENSPKLRRLLAKERFSVTGDEIMLANGGRLTASWAGSPAKRATFSVLDMILDEPDLYPPGAIKDYEERCRAYAYLYKILVIGKPQGTSEESQSWAMYEAADLQLRYEARCPVCETYQVMEFEHIRVPDGVRDPTAVRVGRLAKYECASCGHLWSDHDRNRAVQQGRWPSLDRADTERPEIVAAHLPSWYSRLVSLSTVMADWFQALKDGPEALRSWFNGHAAQPHDVASLDNVDADLSHLIVPELPPLTVPDRALAVTLSADMQKTGFYYSVWAHGMDEHNQHEDWVIDYGRAGDFQTLEELVLRSSWRREGGGDVPLWRALVDSGGTTHDGESESRTQQLYQWLLTLPPGRIFPSKGMSRKTPNQHVRFSELEKLPNGKRMRRSLRLYLLDTDALKDLFFWRLSEESTAPLHFHAATTPDYLRQLNSEKKVTLKNKTFWKPVRANHYLDCAIGHLAMTHFQFAPSLQHVAAALRQRAHAPAPAPRQPTPQAQPAVNPYTTGINPFAR